MISTLIDPPIEIETGDSPDASVIWLHGLGADGNDFVPVVPELPLPDSLSVRFIFPHAPVQPVTCNGGYAMRAWFDIFSLEDFEHEDETGFVASRKILTSLIENENRRGIPTQRIVIMGFSQGGAVALYTGLRHTQTLAGIGALSTWLPSHKTTLDERSAENQATSIFMGHGLRDPVVKYEYGEKSCALLKELDYDVRWKNYDMEHNVCNEEIIDIGVWLVKCLEA
ncbi:MAG: carboxylesterase [Gammaproteobacteria bacterium]|nr:carboxylesterase [Gammaproteobacteria bacterium]